MFDGVTDFNADVYKPRNPKSSDYYQCIESHFEELAGIWDGRYARRYGFLRPYVLSVIYRYLDCGDLHFGFVPAGNALGVPESNVKIADTNIYFRTPASAAISARPAIRNG